MRIALPYKNCTAYKNRTALQELYCSTRSVLPCEKRTALRESYCPTNKALRYVQRTDRPLPVQEALRAVEAERKREADHGRLRAIQVAPYCPSV